MVLVCVFLFTTVFPPSDAQALSPWLSSQNAAAMSEIRAVLERTRVIVAGTEEELALLKENGTQALLYPTEDREKLQYLVSPDIANDPVKLVRALVHEDFEALMQVLQTGNRYNYNSIKELVLPDEKILGSYITLLSEDTSTQLKTDLVINDLIARAFDLIYMTETGFVKREDLAPEEKAFLEAVKPVIPPYEADKYNYFTGGFFDAKVRGDIIKQAVAAGQTFYQAAQEPVLAEDIPGEISVKEKIIEWYLTGAGIETGDLFIATADMKHDRKRIVLRSGEKRASFPVNLPGVSEDLIDVIFLAENEPGHGLVLNLYLKKDYDALPDDARPFLTYKYSSTAGKAVKIDLGRADIVHAAYGLTEVRLPSRTVRAKIKKYSNDIEHVWIGFPEENDIPYPGVDLPVNTLPGEKYRSRKGKLAGEDVVITVSDDANHGRFIFMYAAGDHDKGRLEDPLETYSGILNRDVPRPRAVPYDLAELDILAAAQGKELKIFGREAAAKIIQRGDGTGYCYAAFLNRPETGDSIYFNIPREIMLSRELADKAAIIKVEKHPHRGQIINVYQAAEHGTPEDPVPMVTYRYDPDKQRKCPTGVKTGVCTPIDLPRLTIGDYWEGNIDTMPSFGVDLEATVMYKDENSGKFKATLYKISDTRRNIEFTLSADAKDIFPPDEKGHKINITFREHPDYGPYIALFRDGLTLARYYYFKELGKPTTVDLERLAFIDYILGNKNVNGSQITPPGTYHHKAIVEDRGSLRLDYRGRKLRISGLSCLKGKEPLFISIPDEKYGYKMLVHDAAEYYANENRQPDIILARNPFSRTLTPLDRIDADREAALADPGELLARLADIIGSNENTLSSEAFARLRDLAENARGRTGKLAAKLAEYLDLSDNISMEQAYKNCAILFVLAELMPGEITAAQAVTISKILDYSGVHKDITRFYGEYLFNSIPDSLLYDPSAVKKIDLEKLEKPEIYDVYLRDAFNVPLLTRLGEIKLGVLSQLDDEIAKNKLVESNLRLVLKIAHTFRPATKAALMDLVQEGNIGLLNAAEGFKPQLGYRFSTYAAKCIVNQLTTWFSGNSRHFLIPVYLSQEIHGFKKQCRTAGIDPADHRVSSARIAKTLNVNPEKVDLFRALMVVDTSLNAPVKGKNNSTTKTELEEIIASGSISPSPGANDELLKQVEDDLLVRLRRKFRKPGVLDRYIKICRLRIFPILRREEFETLENIARQCPKMDNRGKAIPGTRISLERVRQLESKMIEILRSVIKRRGLSPVDFVLEKPTYGSPAAALKSIYENFRFEGFKVKTLIPLRLDKKGDPFDYRTVSLEVNTLADLGILQPLGYGRYKLSPAFERGSEAETEALIRDVCDIKFRIKQTTMPLHRYKIPKIYIGDVKKIVQKVLAETYAENDVSEANNGKKLIRWFYSGKGLEDGDILIADVTMGKRKEFARKDLPEGKNRCNFLFPPADVENGTVCVVFAAEEDINHGLVLNCYHEGDYQQKITEGVPCRPIFTYKYYAKAKKALKVDLAALDIVYAGFGFKKMASLDRVYRGAVQNFSGNLRVPIPKEDDCPNKHFEVFLNDIPGDTKMVALLEDDANRGQVINAYPADEYDNGIRIPVMTYDTKLRLADGKKAMQVDLGTMDVLDAADGKELRVFGRPVRAKIMKKKRGNLLCYVYFAQGTPHERRRSFAIPIKYADSGIVGKNAVIVVENDINRGQVINIYLEKTYDENEAPLPIITYQYRNGELQIIDPTALDIGDYYDGRPDIQTVKRRPLEAPVAYHKNGSFVMMINKGRDRGRSIPLYMSDVSKTVYKKDGQAQKASAVIKEEPDYGPYIEIFQDDIILGQVFYFKANGTRKLADFPKMAFIDHALGEHNIRGQLILPREYRHNGNIAKDGSLRLGYLGKNVRLSGLEILAGKTPVFVPVGDERSGYIFHAHDAGKYEKDPARRPEATLVRCAYNKTFVTLDGSLVSAAKEVMGNLENAYSEELIEKIKNAYADISMSLKRPHSVVVNRRMDFYLSTLGEAILKEREHEKNDLLGFLKVLAFLFPDMEEKLGKGLSRYLDAPDGLSGDARVNIAALYIMSELTHLKEKKSLARQAAGLLKYKGPLSDEIKKALRVFCESMPDELVFVRDGLKKTGHVSTANLFSRYLNDIKGLPRLTPLGEIRMGILTRLGDRKAKDDFIYSSVRLVISIAKGYIRWTGAPLLELCSAGNVGLTTAVKKFDPARMNRFSTYAYWWIEQEIRDFIKKNRNLIHIPAHKEAELTQFRKACRVLKLDASDERTPDEKISKALDMNIKQVQELRELSFIFYSKDRSVNKKNEAGNRANSPKDTFEKFLGAEDANHGRFINGDTFSRIHKKVTESINNQKYVTDRTRAIQTIILEKRLLPTLAGENALTLQEIANGFNLTRERIRQNETPVIEILKKALKELGINNHSDLLEEVDTNGSGSPTEAMRVIYKNFNFAEFDKNDLYLLREPYAASTVDIEVRMLKKLDILVPVKEIPRYYRLSETLIGPDDKATEENIAAVYNIKVKTGPRATPYPLDRYQIPENKIDAVRERVRMELMHRHLLEAISTEPHKNEYIIKAWRGYAGAGSQESMLTRIQKMTKNGPYKADFRDMQLEKLVDFAVKNKDNENIVTILPYNLLSSEQREKLKMKNVRVIFMCADESRLYCNHIGGIIAAGIAYLNRNDLALMRLYRLLTEDLNAPAVTVEDLVRDPSALRFVLAPMEARDISDLRVLNERMEELLRAV